MMNTKSAKEFQKLLDVADRLLGEDGCPWDKEQTYLTLRSSLLEECFEVLEAIDQEDVPNLTEELGDLLYNIVFLGKLGEKMRDFTLAEVLELLRDKLISRHPHVFGNAKAKNAAEVVVLYEEVKKQEKKRKNPLEGIPKALPALARGYQLAKRLKKQKEPQFQTAEELGDQLWDLICQARSLDIDPESALRNRVRQEEF